MTPQELAIVEDDLRWYFTQADGELGVRSTFAGMEGRANVTAKCKPAKEGQIHLHEDHCSTAEFDGLPARMAAAAKRASAIRQRLSKIDASHVRTLEVAFACDVDFGGVPVSLACETERAARGFIVATSEIHRTLAARLERKRFQLGSRDSDHESVVPDKAERHDRLGEWYTASRVKCSGTKTQSRSAGLTCRAWLATVAGEASLAGRDPCQVKMIAEIIEQAKNRLDAALGAYAEVR